MAAASIKLTSRVSLPSRAGTSALQTSLLHTGAGCERWRVRVGEEVVEGERVWVHGRVDGLYMCIYVIVLYIYIL